MSFDWLAVSRCQDQATNHKAHFGGCAFGQAQQPQRHSEERDVHTDDPSRSPFLTIAPACQCIPQEEKAADQAQDTEHVLTRCGPLEVSKACPWVILFGHFWKILDEQNGK